MNLKCTNKLLFGQDFIYVTKAIATVIKDDSDRYLITIAFHYICRTLFDTRATEDRTLPKCEFKGRFYAIRLV